MAISIGETVGFSSVKVTSVVKAKHVKAKQKHCLDLHTKIISRSGLWKGGKTQYGVNFFLHIFTRLIVAISSLVVISQAIDSFSNFSNMEFLTENLYVSIIYSMGIVKVLAIMLKPNAVKRLISDSEKLKRPSQDTSKEEKHIFVRHRNAIQMLTVGFLIVCGITSAGFSFIPVFDVQPNATARALPCRMWTPYDHTTTPNYEITYGALTVSSILAGLSIGVFDTLFVAMMITVIGQFKILQLSMKNIRTSAMEALEAKRQIRCSQPIHISSVKKCDKPLSKDNNFQKVERRKHLNRKLHLWESEGRFEKYSLDYKSQLIAPPRKLLLSRRKKLATNVRVFLRKDGSLKENKKLPSSVSQVFGEKIDSYKNKAHEQYSASTNVSETLQHSFLKEEVDYEMQSSLGRCVEHHISILNFINDLESVFWGVLVHQIMTSLAICVVVYQITMSPHFNVKVGVMLMVVFAGVTQLFLYCWFSSVVTHESYNLNEAMYYSDWLDASASFKRSIQIIMCRTEQCPQIMVAGFLPLSLVMFRKVLKQTYSLYSLITGLEGGVAVTLQNGF